MRIFRCNFAKFSRGHAPGFPKNGRAFGTSLKVDLWRHMIVTKLCPPSEIFCVRHCKHVTPSPNQKENDAVRAKEQPTKTGFKLNLYCIGGTLRCESPLPFWCKIRKCNIWIVSVISRIPIAGKQARFSANYLASPRQKVSFGCIHQKYCLIQKQWGYPWQMDRYFKYFLHTWVSIGKGRYHHCSWCSPGCHNT